MSSAASQGDTAPYGDNSPYGDRVSFGSSAAYLDMAVRGQSADTQQAQAQRDAIDLAHTQARRRAESGDLGGARTLLEDALAAGELSLGRDHPRLVPLMVDLATIARSVGNLTEAQSQLQRAYGIVTAAGGPDHPSALSIEGRLALVTHRLGDSTHDYDAHLVEVGAKVLGNSHPAVRGAKQRLGQTAPPSRLAPRAPTSGAPTSGAPTSGGPTGSASSSTAQSRPSVTTSTETDQAPGPVAPIFPPAPTPPTPPTPTPNPPSSIWSPPPARTPPLPQRTPSLTSPPISAPPAPTRPATFPPSQSWATTGTGGWLPDRPAPPERLAPPDRLAPPEWTAPPDRPADRPARSDRQPPADHGWEVPAGPPEGGYAALYTPSPRSPGVYDRRPRTDDIYVAESRAPTAPAQRPPARPDSPYGAPIHREPGYVDPAYQEVPEPRPVYPDSPGYPDASEYSDAPRWPESAGAAHDRDSLGFDSHDRDTQGFDPHGFGPHGRDTYDFHDTRETRRRGRYRRERAQLEREERDRELDFRDLRDPGDPRDFGPEERRDFGPEERRDFGPEERREPARPRARTAELELSRRPELGVRPDRAKRQGKGAAVLVTILVVATMIAGGVVAVQAIRAENAAQGQGRPTTSRPAGATPIPGASAPTGVALADHGGSVTLTWADPSGGRVPFIIAGGRSDAASAPLLTVPVGRTSATIYGLNTKFDYCYTVAAVWSTDVVAPSARTCTNRLSTAPASPVPTAS